jgi:thiol-disulfide isomerase/thioredoxin
MIRALLTLPLAAAASLLLAQAENYPNGSTVDNFTVTDIDGTVHDLDAYTSAGKYVVLDFFFYNCGPCQSNAPYYSEFYQTYGCNEGDVVCIEVNYGDPDAMAEAFSHDFAPGFAHPPVIGSASGDLMVSEYGILAFPTFCLIGPGREMIVNDIWPLEDMSTFVEAFPDGADITEQACAVGIEEGSTAHFASVYPTLTTGQVMVSCAGARTQRLEITVYDLLGKPALTTNLPVQPGTERMLDLGTLANGEYLLKLIADGQLVDTRRIAMVR